MLGVIADWHVNVAELKVDAASEVAGVRVVAGLGGAGRGGCVEDYCGLPGLWARPGRPDLGQLLRPLLLLRRLPMNSICGWLLRRPQHPGERDDGGHRVAMFDDCCFCCCCC